MKAQLGAKIAENLKSFGFSNRVMIDQLSRAECKHVTEEMARRSKVDAARFVEVDSLIEQLTGRKKSKAQNVKAPIPSTLPPKPKEVPAQ